ncbi:hypothetical protein [Hyphomicrobium sp. CS1BSMeth3]|uniref:hypothetical protein n=1 Tax=Hyphomicrobium sp. CS1BSMeth3 TaxID=1892844 RepID=UPI00093017EC|nr:hypothetical protein [Hyphomicrobium sp. CS1BSMeth3]
MSTRQRATLDTTAEPAAGARLLLARTSEDATVPPEDIAALRLHELAARLSGALLPPPGADDKISLKETDTEFKPVSLADIIALGRKQTPDTPDDSLAPTSSDAATAAPLVALVSAPSIEAAEAANAGDPAEPIDVATLPAATPSEPLRLAGEAPTVLFKSEGAAEASQFADQTLSRPEIEDETPTAAPMAGDQPLMLADQSAPDIRLVDLIRRQQTLLDQLNRFPPAYDTLEKTADPVPAPAEAQPPSVIEQLAPPPPAVIDVPAIEAEREAPPPLPPAEKIALPPPSLKVQARRERDDAAAEPVLPEHSPMIIQRARAERSGRRMGPAVAAPPSTLPAFLVGLAVAVVIAGVLFVVL